MGDTALDSTKVPFDIWPGRRSLGDDVTVSFINRLPSMVRGHFLGPLTNIFSRHRPLVIFDKSEKIKVRVVLIHLTVVRFATLCLSANARSYSSIFTLPADHNMIACTRTE